VPEAEREKIFAPFYRPSLARARGRRIRLGLALVREIARRHGGEVRCEGRDGGGTCFVVELPRG
jgi:signal transduction histidine kinase